MKVALICERNLPVSTGGGPKLNLWAITEELRMRGHQVHVLYIIGSLDANGQLSLEDRYSVAALQARGVRVSVAIFSGLHPQAVAEILAEIQPDVITSLGSWHMAWCASYNQSVPRVVLVGDPEHLIDSYRMQYEHRDRVLDYNEIVQLHNHSMFKKQAYLPLVQSCDYAFCTGNHSTQWFQNVGFQMEYIPMPVPDSVFPGWRRRKEDMPQNLKPRILMAGHLQGMATLSSLYYLVENVLPCMDDIDDYDWHICGGESLTSDLKRRFKPYPQMQFRGYVEDIRKEMLQADIFLCTTSIPVGTRTRLVEAMSLGSCMVAHSANGIGQPEFENGVNVALADTGSLLAKLIKSLADTPDVRFEMGHAARETFEREFCTAKSAGRIVDKLEEVINDNN